MDRFPLTRGTLLKVKRLRGDQDYPVPDELPDDVVVEVTGFQPGHYWVKCKGKQFLLSIWTLVTLWDEPAHKKTDRYDTAGSQPEEGPLA